MSVFGCAQKMYNDLFICARACSGVPRHGFDNRDASPIIIFSLMSQVCLELEYVVGDRS